MVNKGTTEQKKSHRDDTMIKNKTTQKMPSLRDLKLFFAAIKLP